jgi:hypothetical protein
MADSYIKGYFPSQVVSDQEKLSPEYGLEVGRAIEKEWFDNGVGFDKHTTNEQSFHKLRLYARGEQSIQKYKDELSINGDLSYLNLDWRPVPIIPKFVDIVVNGISERAFDIKAFSQDPYGVSKRTQYMQDILVDMKLKEISDIAEQAFGIGMQVNDPKTLPDSEEELELHMQLNYKQAVELAEEQAIHTILKGNRYENTKKRVNYDLTVLGIGAVKHSFTQAEGVKVDYVDPANLVYSYTESPYFDDLYYVGEVKTLPINEVKKQFPNLTEQELKDISGQTYKASRVYDKAAYLGEDIDKNQIRLLYFNYKTYMNEVYKLKESATGAEKIIMRDDRFDPPVEVLEARFGKLERVLEVLYEGVMVLGTDKILKWELAKNMVRPKSDYTKVLMNYSIVAPRMYKGKIESLVGRITGFADMIQITHLKLQQVMSRMVPDGVYLDADGLAEVDLGNGTNYNPQEALNMFFQTGSIIGRSFTGDGDMNPGKVPIQELQSGSGGNKIQSLISTYNYYLQMMRDVTGLNEARDGSMPDERSLVGVQKLAAANSNTATRHILQSGLYLTSSLCEGISLRISDIIEYSPAREAFVQKIGGHNVATLEEMSNLHLYDFGIFIELAPDEEEKQLLENNIQQALAKNSIELEDAIDVREIKNLKLANQVLKIRRKKKAEKDQQMQQENMRAQAEANAQAQQVAAQAEIQKSQAVMQTTMQLENMKAEIENKKMTREAQLKKELMALEFSYNMQLRDKDNSIKEQAEMLREDRKDDRVKLQSDRRIKEKAAPKFESANDSMEGDFNLGSFEPK